MESTTFPMDIVATLANIKLSNLPITNHRMWLLVRIRLQVKHIASPTSIKTTILTSTTIVCQTLPTIGALREMGSPGASNGVNP
jgi:hypothetical protein